MVLVGGYVIPGYRAQDRDVEFRYDGSPSFELLAEREGIILRVCKRPSHCSGQWYRVEKKRTQETPVLWIVLLIDKSARAVRQ